MKIPAPIYVLLAAVLWGTTGSAQAFAPASAHPIAIGTLRMIIGGSLLFTAAIFKKRLVFKNINKRAMLLAVVPMAAYQPTFFLGVKLTGVAIGTVIALGSAPVFTGLFQWVKGKKPGKNWIISTVISILGCVMLFSGQGQIKVNLNGAVLALGAGLSYAVYVQASQKLLENSSVAAVNGIVFFLSGLILLPTLLFYDLTWLSTLRGIAVVSQLGIVATAIAYSLFAYGLTKIPPTDAVTLTLAEPLTAAMLGIFLIKEQLTSISLLGMFFLFIGLLLTSILNDTDKDHAN
nr:EamA family transporter [uncultured Desulfobacter sp.]